jgi:hypothetical protein
MPRCADARLSLIALCALLLACSSAQRAEVHTMSPEGAPRFSLRFLRGACPFTYEHARWFACVCRLDAGDAIVVVDERDVRVYEVLGAPRFEIAITLTETAARRVQAARGSLVEVPVVVSLDGAPLYAAREYLQVGAAAIRFPVIHLDRLDEGVLRVRPSLVPSDDMSLIDRPELRALFRSLGLLRVSRPR